MRQQILPVFFSLSFFSLLLLIYVYSATERVLFAELLAGLSLSLPLVLLHPIPLCHYLSPFFPFSLFSFLFLLSASFYPVWYGLCHRLPSSDAHDHVSLSNL